MKTDRLCRFVHIGAVGTAQQSKLLSNGGLGFLQSKPSFCPRYGSVMRSIRRSQSKLKNIFCAAACTERIRTRAVVQQQKRGGKVRYALSKIFLPYEVIKYHYPILQKHKALTPIREVRRRAKLIFCDHLKRTVKERKYNSAISEDVAAETRSLLKNVGL